MIVMLIISILAALVLGVAAVAGEAAREAHTRHVVERLDTLMRDYYNTFKTRRVKVRQQVIDAINNANTTAARKGQMLAEARLYALRELMLMEMPDRWSDILLNDTATATPLYPVYLDVPDMSSMFLPPGMTAKAGRTQVCTNYLRQLGIHMQRVNSSSDQPKALEALLANQGAECLYLFITVACGDGEARAQFAENGIGDTDGDGAQEFLDGWGHPIAFMRWVPGFESQIQINANKLTANNEQKSLLSEATKDHDPFDVYRVEQLAFRLVPLVTSSGRNETLGLRSADLYVAWKGITQSQLNSPFKGVNTNSGLSPKLSPYVKVNADGITDYMGASLHFSDPSNYEETASDNIHNHLQGLR
jgi:hypothetical protein